MDHWTNQSDQVDEEDDEVQIIPGWVKSMFEELDDNKEEIEQQLVFILLYLETLDLDPQCKIYVCKLISEWLSRNIWFTKQ